MLNFLARNLDSVLATYGYLAVFFFVGIESIGIPVPGETMLVTAAIYAGTTGRLSIFWVIVASSAGAIGGQHRVRDRPHRWLPAAETVRTLHPSRGETPEGAAKTPSPTQGPNGGGCRGVCSV